MMKLPAVFYAVLRTPFHAALRAAILCLPACAALSDGEEPALYARAQGAYAEGQLAKVSAMLAGCGLPPALVLRGKAEYFSGDLAGAERSFRRALKKRPGAPEAVLYLARTLRERGAAAEASELILSLLSDDPGNSRALRLASELARERGPAGEAEALALLDRAAESAAEDALVFMDRARQRWIAGRGEEALEDLRRARILLPWDTPMVRSIGVLESAIRERMQ
ncbi:MAG: tetratricopeptide repeat protein [Treponema sp.]|jgi:tetratricopeptide (TPR) repeat protein|nr:tetratricopeptide repeat protein [Treponema sp.]